MLQHILLTCQLYQLLLFPWIITAEVTSVSESRSLLNTDGKKNLEHLWTPLSVSYQKTLKIREKQQTLRTELISTFTYKNYSNMMAPVMWVTSGTCFITTVKNSLWFSYSNWKPEKASNVLYKKEQWDPMLLLSNIWQHSQSITFAMPRTDHASAAFSFLR